MTEDSNVISLPRAAEESPEFEVRIAIMEENLAAIEKTVLVLAHSAGRVRAMLDEIKAMHCWDWKIPAAQALFGDAVLFRDYEVRVTPRPGSPVDDLIS